MKLSCVTAVYNAISAGNRERLIRCVESVAALKTEHEHLIYDGASGDGTVEILRGLEKRIPGLKVVSEKDTGLYNALNKGVRDAKGEWLYVLGCDDYIAWPETFDEVMTAIPSGTDVVAAKVKMDRQGVLCDQFYRRWRILIGMPYCHQGMISKTACVREVGGFDERYRVAADYDMVLKFHFSGKKVFFVNKLIAVFSLGGMSTNGTALFTEGPVTAARLRLSPSDTSILLAQYVIPLHTAVRLLFHVDPTVRIGALYMIGRWTRCLDKGGLKKWLRCFFKCLR